MVKFPRLRALMATYGLSKTGLSRLIKKCPASVTYKLQGNVEFKWQEIQTITQFFKDKDPAITSDFIFSVDGN
jgi:hypothetical protein